ncbi:FMN-linked oxidoreductase [Ceraceosorus guamensis]|uniref:tRNA-dihydrouridine(16/17) synthase [NAD(P)(+)] n=1 Tax=Ceraceosorus guamensis TaxID=1522189 RepID=A0A316W076_9BASI|nr:FMN-linked oxidoreductase [Ceraceosorus guamensis]PWN41961.1 FMN-linked oxidoreductase [Ceraceosorus guamensis]
MPVSDDGSSRPSSALGGAGGSVGPAVAEASPPETHIPLLDDFPPTGTPEHTKLGGWDLWKSMGSPKRVVAPMVDQSELAWRVLSRRHGSDLVYTPMINARAWVDAARATAAKSYKEANFNRLLGEEGSNAVKSTAAEVKVDTDRPLIVQFCANDADALLSAAKDVEAHCDAVDLNLGCPQGIARKGHYGAFLQEDWPLIFRLINNLHLRLRVAVTAKMRVYPNVERTIAYARMLERAGAQIITVHGRTRDMKGQKTGLADWNKIRAVKEAVGVPVIANGNVLFPADVEEALRVTGADAVMSAEGNLYTPTIFADAPSSPSALYPLAPRLPFPDIVVLAREYLDIVATLKTPTAVSAIRSHLFRLCRPALEVHRDMRADLGQSRPSGKDHKATGEARVDGFRAFVDALEERLSPDRTNPNYLEAPAIPRYGSTPLRPEGASALAEGTTDEARPTYVPHWLAQPYFRPENPVAEELTPEQKAANAAARAVRKAEAMAKDAKRLGRSHEGSAAASTSSVATADSAATQDRPVKTRDIQAAGEAAADGSSAIIEIVSDDMHGTRQQAEVGPSTKRAGEAEGGVLAPGEDDAPLSKKLRVG